MEKPYYRHYPIIAGFYLNELLPSSTNTYQLLVTFINFYRLFSFLFFSFQKNEKNPSFYVKALLPTLPYPSRIIPYYVTTEQYQLLSTFINFYRLFKKSSPLQKSLTNDITLFEQDSTSQYYPRVALTFINVYQLLSTF